MTGGSGKEGNDRTGEEREERRRREEGREEENGVLLQRAVARVVVAAAAAAQTVGEHFDAAHRAVAFLLQRAHLLTQRFVLREKTLQLVGRKVDAPVTTCHITCENDAGARNVSAAGKK